MGRPRPKPVTFHFIPFHSAGLPGRVKRNPDNALLSGFRFTGCNWKPFYTLKRCSWKPCWCVQWETECVPASRSGKQIYVWKDPAVKTAGYPNPMPTALPCAVRHIIWVASQFIGWVIYAGTNVLGRANAWSENADPEGRQAEWNGARLRSKLK